MFLTLPLGLTFWRSTARLLREREYVLAARAMGLRELSLLRRHVLPNAIAIVVVSAALQVGTAILVEASLSFLGLGDRTAVSWG